MQRRCNFKYHQSQYYEILGTMYMQMHNCVVRISVVLTSSPSGISGRCVPKGESLHRLPTPKAVGFALHPRRDIRRGNIVQRRQRSIRRSQRNTNIFNWSKRELWRPNGQFLLTSLFYCLGSPSGVLVVWFLSMDEDGGVADDHGSGWLEVKKVIYCPLCSLLYRWCRFL